MVLVSGRAAAGGDDDVVDNVDEAVGGAEVGSYDRTAVHEKRALGRREGERFTVERAAVLK